MRPGTARLLVRFGWLLTPVVAWAVSFPGGWIGALLGTRLGSDYVAFGLLAAGSLVGAFAGAAGWIVLLRRVARTTSQS